MHTSRPQQSFPTRCQGKSWSCRSMTPPTTRLAGMEAIFQLMLTTTTTFENCCIPSWVGSESSGSITPLRAKNGGERHSRSTCSASSIRGRNGSVTAVCPQRQSSTSAGSSGETPERTQTRYRYQLEPARTWARASSTNLPRHGHRRTVSYLGNS